VVFVTARNSSFIYKEKAVDIKQIGAWLGVRYVLEGSARKACNRVRMRPCLAERYEKTFVEQIWHRRALKLK
jgi:adenylate cyclase